MSHQLTDQIGRQLKNISADIKKYAEKRIELLAVTIADNYTGLLAKSTHKIAGILVLTVGLLFLLIALALFMGELVNSRSLGYLIVSLPLFIGGYLLYILKPESLTEKIKQEYEEDLVSLLADEDETNEKKLSYHQSQERLKDNKEYDG